MNALLKFQAQQEDQFLQSILAHDFEQLCAEHVDFFQNNLQSQFDYHQFSKKTARAKNPLHHSDDLISYMALYGWGHYLRMQAVFAHSFQYSTFEKHIPIQACIVDYGCGQGIATLAWIEYVLDQGYSIDRLDVILVEPSAAALARASHWITQKAQHHDIKLNIIHHACTLDELEPDFMAANINQLPSIHLLSNVLDMYLSVQFSMSHLCHEMKQYARHSKHYVYAVSPDFITGNKGFDTFHQLLSPQQLYLNHHGTVRITEYNLNSRGIQERPAPIRAYAACI